MKAKSNKKTNGTVSFLKKLAYWKKPTFQTQDESFLVEHENFGTGLWRATRIFIEYMRGFYAFRHIHNCVTVFGSARFNDQHPYYKLAEEVGKSLAKAGFTVMTGGGPGIMEAANRGAKENQGQSISCNIQLPEFARHENPNPYVDTRISLKYFFVRKVMLTKYSSAFIFMPGGFGTLDELFEMVTLIQTGKITKFPVVLMAKDFWQPLLSFMRERLLHYNTIVAEDIDRLLITDSSDEAIAHIKNSLANITSNPHE